MIAKVHTNPDKRILIAVCDTNLLGQRFEEGALQLDLTTAFYKGEERSPQEIGDLIRNADMVSLVGEQAIAIGIQEAVIDAQNIKRIQGIPFATAVREG